MVYPSTRTLELSLTQTQQKKVITRKYNLSVYIENMAKERWASYSKWKPRYGHKMCTLRYLLLINQDSL